MLVEDEKFLETINGLERMKQTEILDTLRSILNDFNNFVNLVLQLKKLIKANTAISVSLIFDQALATIVKETCSILGCDRVVSFVNLLII